ncbi:hypothetical protein JCM17380_50790 [Desulfosporosinus burensis]
MINSKEQLSDICVLGGGPAGYVAAIRAAQLGATVFRQKNVNNRLILLG